MKLVSRCLFLLFIPRLETSLTPSGRDVFTSPCRWCLRGWNKATVLTDNVEHGDQSLLQVICLTHHSGHTLFPTETVLRHLKCQRFCSMMMAADLDRKPFLTCFCSPSDFKVFKVSFSVFMDPFQTTEQVIVTAKMVV